MTAPLHSRSQHGLTVVELMVALAIGLILLGGIGHVFVTNKQANRFASGSAALQENGNFAIDFIAAQLSNAGYVPDPQDSRYRDEYSREAIEQAAYGNVTLPLTGTEGAANASDTIVVNTFPALGPGGAPGQLVDCLGNIKAIADFVGPAGNGVTNTINVQNGASGRPGLYCNDVEVVSGIENMQVLYGEQINGNTMRYVPRGQVTNPYNVIMLRVALLVSTNEELRAGENPKTTYTMFDGDNPVTVTVPADRRLRQVYSTTLSLRNRCAVLVPAEDGTTVCA
jgi:type IV pilus assembly protein PilW